jgi:DNA-binding transcriptional ArsR family regulator
MTEKPKQMELFEAQTTWFHVFREMVDNGDLAKLSGSAIKIYLVVKAHTNFSTGRAFPAIETIADKSGLSKSQVLRELKVLEDFGYLTKTKVGRNNLYSLREKVSIQDAEGRPTAVATWDYLPSTVRDAVADLKNVLVRGEFEGAKIVHIERLQVNVNHVHDGGTVVNVQNQNVISDLENLPPSTREKLLKMMAASKDKEQK